MKNDLVSVVVPLYNKEEYILECANSIINQTYKNIEIIIVNDGSSDNSKKICEQLAKKDKRINLINQKNLGTYMARYNGIKNSHGKYIMFIDADDYIRVDAIEILYNTISKEKCDVIRFNPEIISNNNTKNNYIYKGKELIEKDDIFNCLLTSNYLNSLCLCFYERKLFNNIKPIEKNIINGEDFLLNLDVFSKVDKVLFLNDYLYYYRYNINSTTKKIDYKQILNNINNFIYCFDKYYIYVNKWDKSDKYKMLASYKILEQTLSILFNFFNVNISKKKFINICKQIMESNVYKNVYKYMSYKDMKKIIKNKSFKYIIKHYINLCNFYKKNYSLLWYNKLVFKIIK
ncbi:MAG: glycosyltransferase family 2 protein [Bacilli bacterium]|nr:glycosyltransferase family 2 protein [Bacilli bacterium]